MTFALPSASLDLEVPTVGVELYFYALLFVSVVSLAPVAWITPTLVSRHSLIEAQVIGR